MQLYVKVDLQLEEEWLDEYKDKTVANKDMLQRLDHLFKHMESVELVYPVFIF